MFEWYYYGTDKFYNGPYPEREDAIVAGRAMTDPSKDFWIMEGRKQSFEYPTADDLLAIFMQVNAGLGTSDAPFGAGVEITDAQKQSLTIAIRDIFSGWMRGNGVSFNVSAFQTIQKEELIPASV